MSEIPGKSVRAFLDRCGNPPGGLTLFYEALTRAGDVETMNFAQFGHHDGLIVIAQALAIKQPRATFHFFSPASFGVGTAIIVENRLKSAPGPTEFHMFNDLARFEKRLMFSFIPDGPDCGYFIRRALDLTHQRGSVIIENYRSLSLPAGFSDQGLEGNLTLLTRSKML